MELGERLRIARTIQHLTQEELATKVHITKQALQRIESGNTRKSKYLPDLARVLDISLDWLMYNDGKMLNNENNLQIGETHATYKTFDNEQEELRKIVDILAQRISVLEQRLSYLEHHIDKK